MGTVATDLLKKGVELVRANASTQQLSDWADKAQECLEDGAPDPRYIEAAINEYAEDGRIEIDDDALISHGDDQGAYVQAWVWVDNDDLPEPEDTNNVMYNAGMAYACNYHD